MLHIINIQNDSEIYFQVSLSELMNQFEKNVDLFY